MDICFYFIYEQQFFCEVEYVCGCVWVCMRVYARTRASESKKMYSIWTRKITQTVSD